MAKILIIANAVFLPISKGFDDKSEQKYFGSSTKGEVFPDQIFTESEVRERGSKSSYGIREADNLLVFKDVWQ